MRKWTSSRFLSQKLAQSKIYTWTHLIQGGVVKRIYEKLKTAGVTGLLYAGKITLRHTALKTTPSLIRFSNLKLV